MISGHSHPHTIAGAADSGHAHGHGHAHAHAATGFAFAVAVALNLALVAGEIVAGLVGGSMALIADAGHNFADALSLLLAWAAGYLASRPPSARFTYGMKSFSILAALANSALLWVALGAILIETLRRLAEPGPTAGGLVMAVAAIGIVINAISALMLARGLDADLNLRAAFQHLLADAAVSAGVVAAGAVVWFTGWRWVDPIASLGITVVIGLGSWGLLRESLRMGLLAVPERIDESAVRLWLGAQPGVIAVHDLHIWPMSTTETALTAHLVMPGGCPCDAFLHAIAAGMEQRFAICHATVQVEQGEGEDCALHSPAVV